jgi:cell wall-associated NlpC family hydrolase
VTELEKQNPTISRKLLVGSVLKIRSSKVVEKAVPAEVVVVEEKRIEENTNANPVMERNAAFVDQLISKASENLGTRYRSGGNTTAGFDCSGLMCYAFSSYDIKLPRSSIEMASYGAKIDSQNAQKGDLIFFKTRGSGRINHVGMVVEVLDGEIKFIHSANHGGVIISSTKESYYQRNLAQVNRVL